MSMQATVMPRKQGIARFLTVLVLLWLSGMGLRITLLAVPPVIPQIHAALAMSETGIGILTGLAPLLFACAAIPGSALIARFGVRRTLIGGLLLTAVASALRGGARCRHALWHHLLHVHGHRLHAACLAADRARMVEIGRAHV